MEAALRNKSASAVRRENAAVFCVASGAHQGREAQEGARAERRLRGVGPRGGGIACGRGARVDDVAQVSDAKRER
jgi:hypothetical protein